ncbi:hypothetical protein [Acetobacter pasteurianus]|uniref:hypothetical protein n=1 Tax=Acetobacter pasteurianus TaxID=438 RepID=UPI00056E2649|nr:hypothetical protein [Acetobacter pasteurianus]
MKRSGARGGQKPQKHGPARGTKMTSDYSVWARAADHYERLASRARFPGIRVWAKQRAQECSDRAYAARNGLSLI